MTYLIFQAKKSDILRNEIENWSGFKKMLFVIQILDNLMQLS